MSITTIEKLKSRAVTAALYGAVKSPDMLMDAASELEALQKENAEFRETQRRMILDAFPVTEERVRWEELLQERDQLRAEIEALQRQQKINSDFAIRYETALWDIAKMCGHSTVPCSGCPQDGDNIAKEKVVELLDQLGELRSTVAQLQRDNERLDWLESKTTKIQIMNDYVGSCGWREFGDPLSGDTVRSAIDAAMQPEKKA